MKLRYFVAVLMPSAVRESLEEYYRKTFSSELPVKNIHMTLVSPFFLESGTERELMEKIGEVNILPFEAKFLELKIFEQKKRILVAGVEPSDKCKELSKTIEGKLNNLITMDTSSYKNEAIPPFEAHVTLDYDFKGEISGNLPELSFLVEKVDVFKEEEGEWKIVGGLGGN